MVLEEKKDNPVKLAYFDVHTDNSTSELSVERYLMKKYHQPNKLKIQFASQKSNEAWIPNVWRKKKN